MEFDGSSGTIRIAIALLVGVATIGYGGYSYSMQSSALDSAEQVTATIVSTSIEKHTSKGISYSPHATYNYTYEGETDTSSNIYPGTLPREFDSKEKARAELAAYEPGETVTAYVPPDAPGNAFLKHESSNKPFIVIGFGLLFALGALRSAFSG
ncbi:MAG: DUF3592 domain-containing protein [Haloplanus sp.]